MRDQRFCTACGAELSISAKFCAACGSPIREGTAPNPPCVAPTSGTSIQPIPQTDIPQLESPTSAPASTFAARFVSEKRRLGAMFWPLMIFLGASIIFGLGSAAKGLTWDWQINAKADVLIKENLRSPDSYRVVSQKVLWNGFKGEYPAHVVKTAFSAQNGFGATIRGCYYTAFYDVGSDQIGHGPSSLQECDYIDQLFGQAKVLEYIKSDNGMSDTRG